MEYSNLTTEEKNLFNHFQEIGFKSELSEKSLLNIFLALSKKYTLIIEKRCLSINKV